MSHPHAQSVVYTCGVFDLFHIGHLNLLRAASGLGDRLVVGVSTDELVESYKPGRLVVPYLERIEIVRSLRFVDSVVPQHDRDKYEAWKRLQFDVWAVGDDWFGRNDYMEWRAKLAAEGVKSVFLPYTRNRSSTELRDRLVTEDPRVPSGR